VGEGSGDPLCPSETPRRDSVPEAIPRIGPSTRTSAWLGTPKNESQRGIEAQSQAKGETNVLSFLDLDEQEG
jgi:hypothetical protein